MSTDRSLDDGRQFGPYGRELFEEHVSRALEGGGTMQRLGDPLSPQVRWEDLSARIGRNEKPGVLFSALVTGMLSERELRKGLEDT